MTTAMTGHTSSITHATCEQTAKESVSALGNTSICYGPFTHRVQGALIDLVSEKVSSLVSTLAVGKMKEEIHKK